MSTLQLHRAPVFVTLFDNFFGDLINHDSPIASGVRGEASRAVAPLLRARVDVVEKSESFEIKIDLPGVKREDIHVTIEGALVRISAESKPKPEALEEQAESKDKSSRVLQAERYSSRYARSFELPVEVNDAEAKARFEDGVLSLVLPKKVAAVGRRLAID